MTLEINPYPKQVQFFKSTKRYIAYGGSRGGGKSWAGRAKLVLLAFNYSGIQILLLRRTYAELKENHLIPLTKMLNGIARYKEVDKAFLFPNGSRIKLGYCESEKDVLQYQGQAYDVILMEEATQFTEFQFQTLTESNRSSGLMKEKFTPRMYFTCNPGGCGHNWVKRLFIDKEYRNREKPEDYDFIPSTVYENQFLMENNPEYIEVLENLPEDRKKAMLYGDWDAFEGQFFNEFNRDIHVIEPFPIPSHWKRYIAFDYGMDMLACLWIAQDTEGNSYVYKELHQSGLLVSTAAREILRVNNGDKYEYVYAPRDMWGTLQDTGKTRAQIYGENGLYLTKTSVNRVDGWTATKELMKIINIKDKASSQVVKTSRLKIFNNCVNLIKNLPLLQRDEKDPCDASTNPHEITHICDALRYYAVNFTYPAEPKEKEKLILPSALCTSDEIENTEGGMVEW